MSNLSPLMWPKNLENPSRFSLFFREIPILGLISKRRRAVARQLRQRDRLATLEAWGASAGISEIASEVAELARRYCNWPNANFIPGDPCRIIFSDSTEGLESVSALLALGKRFGLPQDQLLCLREATLGKLVADIDALRVGKGGHAV